ncbi:MAG: tetratricopeptide repeat protein [Acidobacteria bacterium]|nr:tetratricopeptide repeat protein [Acidobacteriota bacterium]
MPQGKQYLSEDTENVDSLYLLGRCQVETSLYSKAIKTFEDGLKIAPDTPELLREIGMAYFLNADFKQSIDLVGKYVVHDQDNASWYFVLAESYDKLGNPQPAISNYKKFLELDDHSDSSRTVQARTRVRLLMSGAPYRFR